MEKFSYVIVLFATVLAVIVLSVGGQGQTVIDAFKIILYAVVATVVLSCLIWLATMAANHVLRWRESRAATRRAERNAQYSVVTAKAGDQVYLHDTDHSARWRAAHRDPRVYADGEWSQPDKDEWGSYILWLESHARGRRGALPGPGVPPMLDGPAQPMDLLGAVAEIECLLIVGPRGAGKTSIHQHLIARRTGMVLVFDPHDDTKTWPAHAQVIGGGQRWDEIGRGLLAVAAEIDERYKFRSTGADVSERYQETTVLIDEWRDIRLNVPGAPDAMKQLLTGGRKVFTSLIVGTHSENARPLGLEGEADLKDGFGIVRLKGGKQFGYWSATLDTGQGEVPIHLPGPYHPGGLIGAPAQPARMLDVSGVELPATDQEREILAMWDGGEHSLSRIGARVYGSRGGWQSERIEDVLRSMADWRDKLAKITDPDILAGLRFIRRAAKYAARLGLLDSYIDARQRERDEIWGPVLRNAKKRREARRVYERWAVSWGTASVGFFENEAATLKYVRQLHGNGQRVRAITRTVEFPGGGQVTQILHFDGRRLIKGK
jgi:hypothetical protein